MDLGRLWVPFGRVLKYETACLVLVLHPSDLPRQNCPSKRPPAPQNPTELWGFVKNPGSTSHSSKEKPTAQKFPNFTEGSGGQTQGKRSTTTE